MKQIKLSDLEFLEIGNTIQQWGCVYSDGKRVLILPFPDEDCADLTDLDVAALVMSPPEWERFLNQTDVVDTVGPEKAILRKSQRQIDAFMQWRVFERDGYKCRYCGQKKPLTVDHIDLWEDGGATTDENLIAACKKCNKTRGRIKYPDWVVSDAYKQLSKNLSDEAKQQNLDLVKKMLHLMSLRVNKVRSR